MPVRVAHYHQPHHPDLLEKLRSLVPDWKVEAGAPGPNTRVLIDGYPTREDLLAAPSLSSVIIPFAGVPPRTRELMLEFLHIELHNLHHNAPETAEVAMALLLACAKKVVPMDQALRKGDWSPRYDPSLSIRLEGKTAVVLGFGAIGQRVCKACLGLGMRVIAHRRELPLSACAEGDVEQRGPGDLHRSLGEADALILALPQTSETVNLLGAAEFAAMKPGAIVVNIARASLVDETALYEALRSGHLRGAGLDVWYRYPESDATKGYMGYIDVPSSARHTFPATLPFHELENVVMSPHRGGTSADVEEARVVALAEMLNSAPMPNRVDLVRGY